MFFLNLTAGEFLALFGALGGLIAALYLLDRAKRKKVVSTLRFWTSASNAEEKQTRRRMRDPLSLILQLVSLALLLLAIAQLQWGSRERMGRDHVLLIDTSAWSAATQADRRTNAPILDREKRLAAEYMDSVPRRDRLMLVRADALAIPVTPFTADRAQLKSALRQLTSGFSALNINQALTYAVQAQAWSGGRIGEIVYVGPKEVGSEETSSPKIPNLRTLAVPLNRDNAGILRVAVKRNENAAGEWQASITVKNYASRGRAVRLRTRFGATVFAPRMLNLAPGQEGMAGYIFDTSGAGQFVADIDPPDALSSDNTIAVALPRNSLLRVAAYTRRADALRPLLEADNQLSVTFLDPSQYQPTTAADVVLLDRFSPRQQPALPSLWIEPPRDSSPLPVKEVLEKPVIDSWNSATALSAGLHEKEAHLATAEVFQIFEGDISIGSVSEGPVVVARPAAPGRANSAVVGFDPLAGDMKYEVATPLLFANLLHWLSPESFRTLDIAADRVGAATITLDPNERADQVRVAGADGEAVLFTIHDRTLQLFTARPNIVRITAYDRVRLLSLTLPDVADREWILPAPSATGLPAISEWTANSVTLWQWLAVLAATGLVSEWMLFGRRRAFQLRKRKPAPQRAASNERESELVSP